MATLTMPAKISPVVVPGTLVYCLRRQGLITVKRPTGEVIALDPTRNTGSFVEWPFEPYGIAWDANRDCLWLAAKQTNAVWQLSLDRTGGVLTPIKKHLLSCAGPCIIDIHPQFGILVACYGCDRPGSKGVLHFDGHAWSTITSANFAESVSHCCWLPSGGYCFVGRSDSVIWYAQSLASAPVALTAKNTRTLSPAKGSTSALQLEYVQGLIYSRQHKRVIAADASLGAIYSIDVDARTYQLLAGFPQLTDSTRTSSPRIGPANVWLGRIRGIVEIGDSLVWIDGESGQVFEYSNGRIDLRGPGCPVGALSKVRGTGIVAF